MFLLVLLAMALVTACGPWRPDPVDEPRVPAPPTDTRPPVQPPPPIYEVRRGDTLYSIAFRFGLDWRKVADWNDIDEPYTIRPGQELRMSAPPRVAETTPTETKEEVPQPKAPEPESRPDESADPDETRRVAGVDWRWPTEGRVTRPFDPSATRRGIGIGGESGQTVVAAAEGDVVYSGAALIGYGDLIIIKHSESMLSAYGHNRRRLVNEGDRVRAGQAIAEMGRNERDEEILHFEIRRDGRPEDPLKFLPAR